VLKDQALGVLVDVWYAWAWRQDIDVAVKELELEERSNGWECALRHVVEPIRHPSVLLPYVGIRILPRLTTRVEKVHVPFRLDLAYAEHVDCRIEGLLEDLRLG
jgi:hypothetical protein